MHIAEAILLIIGASSLRDPDEFVNTSTLIRSKGYPAEEHDVTTQDGYILTLFRIPNPDKPVVFLQHGLLDASSSFVINFPEQSLGFVLWDAGYDVWIGNMRGSYHLIQSLIQLIKIVKLTIRKHVWKTSREVNTETRRFLGLFLVRYGEI